MESLARRVSGLLLGAVFVMPWANDARGASAKATAAPPPLAVEVAPPKVIVRSPTVVKNAGGAATSKPKPVATAAQVTITAPLAEQLKLENVGTNQADPHLKVTDGTATLSVEPGQQLIVKREEAAASNKPPVQLSDAAKNSLEATVLVGTRDAQDRPSVRQFQPFVLAEVTPLRWDTESRTYQTTLLVGLDPLPGDSSAGFRLDTPIPFQLTGENLERIVPTRVSISEAGPSGYQRVLLSTSRFAVPVKVSAHSTAGDGTFSAQVEPGPVSFALSVGEASIDGLGLGKTTITARRVAANGELLPGASALGVELSTSAGSLRPSRIELSEKATSGRTELVSAGFGRATVSQAGAAGTVQVSFAFPWLKLLLGIAGAAAAGALQVLALVGPKRAWVPGLLGAVLGGLALAIVVALGAPFAPEWLRQAISSELCWLAVGVIGGYPGPRTLEWLNQKIFGGKGTEKPEPQPQH